MAVLERIFHLFIPDQISQPEVVIPAPPTTYEIHPLTEKNLKEVLKLNLRCFQTGEHYTRFTFNYLLNEPNCLSYRVATAKGEMVGFIFVMMNTDGMGHITTIGVTPEHRRRGLAVKLLEHAEKALLRRGVSVVMLEVRVSNRAAQDLYRERNYQTVQRLTKYYNNGEDGFLMVKPLS